MEDKNLTTPINFGLISVEPTKEDYIFQTSKIRLGGLPLRPDGQWDDYLPTVEAQNVGVETNSCTSHGTLNCVEILMRQEFGDRDNLSDRFSAKMSGTWPPGNDPAKIAETLRKKGNCLESDWPFTKDMDTLEKFYADIPENIKTLALQFKAEFDFGHEWVSPDTDSMKEALKYSPLGVAVYAWEKDAKGYYIRPPKAGDVHWVAIFGYKLTDIGEIDYWKCFDSYPDSDGVYIKKLRGDFGFSMVKKYTLHKNIIDETWFGIFKRLLRKIVGL